MLLDVSEISYSFLLTLERRIIFDYDKYGDSPNCLGKDELEDLAGQVGLTQGKKTLYTMLPPITDGTIYM